MNFPSYDFSEAFFTEVIVVWVLLFLPHGAPLCAPTLEVPALGSSARLRLWSGFRLWSGWLLLRFWFDFGLVLVGFGLAFGWLSFTVILIGFGWIWAGFGWIWA